MVQDETGVATPTPEQPQQRIQTEIEFPYADLEAAVEIVRQIHSRAGSSCEDEEAAAWLDMSVHGGTFRSRRSSARMFGLIEASGRRLTLTPLGHRVADDNDRAARAEAFLRPQLFSTMYDQWRGQVLPPPAALERQMGDLGVPPKQKMRARQVFQKSATYAGFIDGTSGRFVRPSSGSVAPDREPAPLEKAKGGGGGDEPPRHPLIEGLFQSLPKEGEIWTVQDAAEWLEAAAVNLRIAYKFKGRIKVTVEGQGGDGTGGRIPAPG
jgi:hypothetical protein